MNNFCSNFETLFNGYIIFAISTFGFILNTLCLIAFIHIIRFINSKENIFKYLITKSICDSYLMARLLTFRLIDSSFIQFNFESTLHYCILHQIFDSYVSLSLQMMSIYCEIAANFNRYRKLVDYKIFNLLNRIPVLMKIILIGLFSFAFYSFKFIEETCMLTTMNTTDRDHYKLITTSLFQHELTQSVMTFLHTILRDGLGILFIVLLNILMYVEIRKLLNKKRQIQIKSNNDDSKINKTERTITLMVIASSMLTVCGHVLIFVYKLPIIDNQGYKSNRCLRVFSLFFYYVSYSSHFFIYFLFNNHFRRVFTRCFLDIKKMYHSKTKSMLSSN